MVMNVDNPGSARLQRVGDVWAASFGDRTVHLRDTKGMRDLAALLARPGVWLSALDLAGSDVTDDPSARPEPVLDRAAAAAYRQRLAVLSDEIDVARSRDDPDRQRRAIEERERLLTELRRATRPGGAPRALGTTATERARKAVSARIRDAIRRITDAYPELGHHLDRTIQTGARCRYEP